MKREFSITNTTPGGQQTIHLIIADISMDEFMSCTDTKITGKNGAVLLIRSRLQTLWQAMIMIE